VVIRGSDTVGEEPAPTLVPEFKKAASGILLDLEITTTGYGMAAFRAGQWDITAASRTISAN